MGERLTLSDKKKIEAEIEHRKLVLRPEILDEVKEARAQGDLSENFEYKAAKQAKRKNDGRIRYLENVLKHAVIISDESADDEAGINKWITVYCEEDEEEDRFKLVTSIRGDSLNQMISIESPLGKAVRGHRVGDKVTVQVENGYSYEIEIMKIEEDGDDDDAIRAF